MTDGQFTTRIEEVHPKREWASAFATAQENFPHVGKDSTAKIETQKGSYEYSYASLDSILTAVLPVLNANGLSLAQSPIFDDGRVGVETRIYHISGHVETFGPLYLPAGQNAQAAGSAITYARRYSLCAALGISPEEDDDGAKAIAPVKEAPQQSGADWLATAVQMFGKWDDDQMRSVAKGVMSELEFKNPLSLEQAKKVHAGMAKAYYLQHPNDDGAPF